eukprot:757881-Hanusia_phi.AAC.4
MVQPVTLPPACSAYRHRSEGSGCLRQREQLQQQQPAGHRRVAQGFSERLLVDLIQPGVLRPSQRCCCGERTAVPRTESRRGKGPRPGSSRSCWSWQRLRT